MTYQVMARKWRPQKLDEIVGQPHIAQTLENALANNRLHHALLFTGPRGTGKTSTARILAKAVRCPNSKNFVPCNTCDICEDINLTRSVDVIEIDGASNNGVDAIRELRDGVGYMPSSGSKKIYIIDEVHMLTTSAFNALLKTLEEPPPHVLFVMATTEVHKIPATILSRLQRFDFRRIPMKAIVEHLGTICEKEKVKADKEALWLIARQAEGSMRDAQSLLDQVVTFSDGQLTAQKVTENLGLSNRALIAEIMQAIARRDRSTVADQLTKIFDSGCDPDLFIKDLLFEIRTLSLVQILKDKANEALDLPQTDLETYTKMSKDLTAEDVQILYDIALKGASDVSRSPDPQTTLDMILLRLSMAPRMGEATVTTGSARTSAPPVLRSAPTGAVSPTIRVPPPTEKPVTKAAASPAPYVEEKPKAASPSGDKWTDLVNKIKVLNTPMGSQLEHTAMISETSSLLTIGVPQKYKFVYDQAQTESFRKKMENYIKTYWGISIAVRFELLEGQEQGSSPAVQAEQKAKVDADVLRQQVENHPLVKMTKSVFKSEIHTIHREEK